MWTISRVNASICPEAGHEQDDERAEVDDHERGQRAAHEQPRALQPGAVARTPPRRGGGPLVRGPASLQLRRSTRRQPVICGPGLLPGRVVHAVLLPAEAAVGDRGLPEVDRVEVRRRLRSGGTARTSPPAACSCTGRPRVTGVSPKTIACCASPAAWSRTSSTGRRSSGAEPSWPASTCPPSPSFPPSGSCP